ncbi:hypothetical protein GGX14DRAFT_446459 [Mycena pura]|uniref:Protein kinase domain-containing protein n=1 Tax=Mycena pura TaxID=153505 RepID=A0AAD6VHJ8_9AGAR|nr:hypothetical protein GGX14DRAFT_446459 [Mycena pura]
MTIRSRLSGLTYITLQSKSPASGPLATTPSVLPNVINSLTDSETQSIHFEIPQSTSALPQTDTQPQNSQAAAETPQIESEYENAHRHSFGFDSGGFMEPVPPASRSSPGGDPVELGSGSIDISNDDMPVEEDQSIALLKSRTRDSLTDPRSSDDANCLAKFKAYSGDIKAYKFWSVDMRLTLLWCLAYEARFRRSTQAIDFWLSIVGGGLYWDIWEDGDERWLRKMIIDHRMQSRFRDATSLLSSWDWMRARTALERRIGHQKRYISLKSWTVQQRVLRMAWCVVSDGFPMLGKGKGYYSLRKPIDSWIFFTAPFRLSHDPISKISLHDKPDCALAACPVALSEIGASELSGAILGLAMWPVVLWVAFQTQTRKSKDLDDFLAIIESDVEENLGLWSWDDEDENIIRKAFISSNSLWNERLPSSWLAYIKLLDADGWASLEALTHRSSRTRLAPVGYDTAIRIGAIVLWSSSNSTADSSYLESLLAFEIFLPNFLGLDSHGFLQCLLERRVPVRASYYELNLGPETIDWHYPRSWLINNRVQLRSSVLQDPETVLYMHVVENVSLVYHGQPALPLRFMASVFAGLLKNSSTHLDKFRAWIQTLKTWDTTACLINFRWVLSNTFEFSKLIKGEDLPKSVINVLVHTDILCVCAQLADILSNRVTYQEFLKTRNEEAQKLLDLIQDLLDYPLLDDGIRPVILKALLRLSTTSSLHPRCFVLSDRLQLDGHQVAAGSFGDVWKGRIHGEIVSVKVMRVYQEADVEALLKEFYREALIWRQLSHPNLLPFFGAYYLEGSKSQLCLVSPWMENGNIARYLKGNPVGVNKLSLVLDVALGLEHIHGLKLVHGDLKAINVLVTRSGRAVLADFGLSSVSDSKILSAMSTSTVKSGGTARWQAPELFAGNPNSFASDVYAFSFVCYEILTGTLPFKELIKDVAVMFQVMHGHRPKRTSSIVDDVWSLMEDCWQEDPQKRPSAEQIVFRLRDRPINAVPTNAASDWVPWYTSKFRSSLEEHTLFLSGGGIELWLQVPVPAD